MADTLTPYNLPRDLITDVGNAIADELLRASTRIYEARVALQRATVAYEQWQITLKLRARGAVIPGKREGDGPECPTNEAECKLALEIVIAAARRDEQDYRDAEDAYLNAERMLEFEKNVQENYRIVYPTLTR